ncbi:MAG: DUF2318 domain-containing protein [Treponema sp.]|nr:DUF2318 domain-containing protein [Treponema sp.]
MLKYLVDVVENLLAAGLLSALVCGVSVICLGDVVKNANRWGVISGGIVSCILAVVKHRALVRRYEYIAIPLIVLSLVLCVVYSVSIWTSIGNGKRSSEIRKKSITISSALLVVSFLAIELPDVFIYPVRFVEMGQSTFSTDFLFKAIGYVFGLAVVCLTSCAFSISVANLPFATARVLVVCSFAIVAVTHFGLCMQLLVGRRIIRVSRQLFRFIVFVINHEQQFLFLLLATVIGSMIALLFATIRQPVRYTNPAEHRRIRATRRTRRRWAAVVVVGVIFSIVDVTAIKAFDRKTVELSPSEPFERFGDALVIPLLQVSDGHLHRFTYRSVDGNDIRFIIIKKNAHAFGVGFDACEICGATGYYERGNQVVCRLCDVVMNINTIGYKGGCNPIPLKYTIADGNIVIAVADVEVESRRFRTGGGR